MDQATQGRLLARITMPPAEELQVRIKEYMNESLLRENFHARVSQDLGGKTFPLPAIYVRIAVTLGILLKARQDLSASSAELLACPDTIRSFVFAIIKDPDLAALICSDRPEVTSC